MNVAFQLSVVVFRISGSFLIIPTDPTTPHLKMICARCRDVLQCIVSNDATRTTGSELVEREQCGDDESPELERRPIINTHHATYRSLREAIDQGCSVCIAFWEYLDPDQQSFLMHFPWPHQDSTSAPSESPGVCTELDGYPQRAPDQPGYEYWINIHYPVSGSPFFTSFESCLCVLEPLDGAIS